MVPKKQQQLKTGLNQDGNTLQIKVANRNPILVVLFQSSPIPTSKTAGIQRICCHSLIDRIII